MRVITDRIYSFLFGVFFGVVLTAMANMSGAKAATVCTNFSHINDVMNGTPNGKFYRQELDFATGEAFEVWWGGEGYDEVRVYKYRFDEHREKPDWCSISSHVGKFSDYHHLFLHANGKDT